ncbi:MAG: sugar-binding protein, partial [Lentisphaeria bacterium]|nr:sugar-binding protein [Lentisphaeria bacterium]
MCPRLILAAVVSAATMATVATAVAARTNLLENPGFEQVDAGGMPVNWHLAKHPRADTPEPQVRGAPAHSGEKAVQFEFGPELEWAIVEQTERRLFLPGERYSLSVWLRANTPARASVALLVLGGLGQGEEVIEIQSREWVDVAPEWHRYSTSATVDDRGQYVVARCIVQLHTPNVSLSIDDAALVLENAETTDDALHPTHSVGCVRTTVPPVLDGRLDDACWARAGVAGGFTNTTNSPSHKPSQQTEVYLLHDDENLYVAYRCFESEFESVKAEKTGRDAQGLWGDDCIELYLIPPDSAFPETPIVGTDYYYLVVNSIGTQSDNVGQHDVDQWTGNWEARTAREGDAWTVEIQIPLAVVDSRPAEGALWKVNFTRSQKRLRENSSWAPIAVRFHDPSRFADMYFVNDQGQAALVMAAAAGRQVRKITGKWRLALSSTADEIERLDGLLRTQSRPDTKNLLRRLDRAGVEIADLLGEIDSLKPREIIANKTSLNDRMETALAAGNALANSTAALLFAQDNRPFIVRAAPVITDERILPTSLLSHRPPPRELALAACPAEYESVSFVVVPSRNVEQLTVSCSDLESAAGVIGAAAVDIKLVKCWFQGGGGWTPGGVQTVKGKVLVPELLVNDDDLVRVDLEKKQNLLRVADPDTGRVRYEDVTVEANDGLTSELIVRDAPALLPVDIPVSEVRQFWVTVHVPPDAAAGVYEGNLTIGSAESSAAVVPLRLQVHPFKLAPSMVEQSIFYRGVLSGSETPVIHANNKTEVQYAAELNDLVAHGVDAPLCYQTTGEGRPAAMALMKRVFEMRRDAGISTDRFFGCFWGYGPNDDPELARRVLGQVVELTKTFGYRDYYNYGPDEAGVEQCRQQIAPWRFLREEIGAKVYLAASPAVWTGTGPVREELWNQFKGVVNLVVAGGVPNPDWAARLHEAGLLIYNYANPQGGIEEPLTYRRNFGLLLWKAGYDGVMTYAYQAG